MTQPALTSPVTGPRQNSCHGKSRFLEQTGGSSGSSQNNSTPNMSEMSNSEWEEHCSNSAKVFQDIVHDIPELPMPALKRSKTHRPIKTPVGWKPINVPSMLTPPPFEGFDYSKEIEEDEETVLGTEICPSELRGDSSTPFLYRLDDEEDELTRPPEDFKEAKDVLRKAAEDAIADVLEDDEHLPVVDPDAKVETLLKAIHLQNHKTYKMISYFMLYQLNK